MRPFEEGSKRERSRQSRVVRVSTRRGAKRSELGLTDSQNHSLKTRAVEQSFVNVVSTTVRSSVCSQTAPCLPSSLGVDLPRRGVVDLLSAREAEFSTAFRTGLSDESSQVGEVGGEGGLELERKSGRATR